MDEVAEVGAAGDRKPNFVFSCAIESLGESGAGTYKQPHTNPRAIYLRLGKGPENLTIPTKLLLFKNGCVLSLSQPPNLFSHLQSSGPLRIFLQN